MKCDHVAYTPPQIHNQTVIYGLKCNVNQKHLYQYNYYVASECAKLVKFSDILNIMLQIYKILLQKAGIPALKFHNTECVQRPVM